MKKTLLSSSLLFLTILILTSCKKKDKKDAPPEPATEVHIGDSVKVVFPPGSITATASMVSLIKANNSATKETFEETSSFYMVDKTLPYQIVLNVGKQPPQSDSISISVKLPNYFKTSNPANYGFELFVQIYQEGELEVIDNFVLVPSKYDTETGILTAYLPSTDFTNTRTANKTYEAIMIIGNTPGENLERSGLRKDSKQKADSGCKITQISCPLGTFGDCTKYLGSGFGLRTDPITGKALSPHMGVDFKVVTGTSVYSAADGIVEKAGTGNGYGNIIFVRHNDNSGTLYAHLSKFEVILKQKVKGGQLIAKSGNSGSRTTGQHLHFEYYPSGGIYADKSQQDPFPCITEGNIEGSITVRDNGNLADDAFEVYLDDHLLGKTAIGASNSIAASNLRPGVKTMRLKCIVAPDNVGTYEVILNDGITFESGEVRQSDVLAEGESISWQIIIPNNLRRTNNSFRMRINKVVEKRKS